MTDTDKLMQRMREIYDKIIREHFIEPTGDLDEYVLQHVVAAMLAARNEGLEEAGKLLDGIASEYDRGADDADAEIVEGCAKRLRAMKTKENK